jgi:ribosomal protein L24E
MSENVKDVEKTVLRMSIGRQKREFSQIILQRGYPKNENWTEYQREMHLKSIENNKKLKGFTNK